MAVYTVTHLRLRNSRPSLYSQTTLHVPCMRSNVSVVINAFDYRATVTSRSYSYVLSTKCIYILPALVGCRHSISSTCNYHNAFSCLIRVATRAPHLNRFPASAPHAFHTCDYKLYNPSQPAPISSSLNTHALSEIGNTVGRSSKGRGEHCIQSYKINGQNHWSKPLVHV